ncbi:hypothetical protein RCL_jg7899.t1 [Rhizophagus clarus]|uniref:Uncharacterized protein n=1 Tax=Rhizophagus clarus TaxID=94130 RepID=A0A8H3R5T0_9GLOM|nr:hypothetical protein RCL_jg7899.t1 [Rhizophagus clarus]
MNYRPRQMNNQQMNYQPRPVNSMNNYQIRCYTCDKNEYEINYIDGYNEGEYYEEYDDGEEINEINYDMFPV